MRVSTYVLFAACVLACWAFLRSQTSGPSSVPVVAPERVVAPELVVVAEPVASARDVEAPLRPPVESDVQPVALVLNELLAANRRTNVDEEGRSSDWIELYNTAEEPLRLDGYYLSDEIADPRKWALPERVVPPLGHVLLWLSGKGAHAREVAGHAVAATRSAPERHAAPAAFVPRFIRAGDPWRYRVPERGERHPPAGWMLPGFSGEGFLRGPSGFGFGDGDDATSLPRETTVVFLRKEFQIAAPERITSLLLSVDYDDGFVAYLNGRRVAGANSSMSEPDATARALAKHEAGTPELFDLSRHAGLLRAGANTLAVVGLNDRPSSDMSLIPELGTAALLQHAPFRLPKAGGTLLLSRDASILEQLTFPPQVADVSYGRAGDGAASWGFFPLPTPAASNRGPSLEEPVRGAVVFEPAAGRYDGPLRVRLAGPAHEQSTVHEHSPAHEHFTVRYTLDGTEPRAGSAVYDGELDIERSTVVRAAGFLRSAVADGERVTPVASASYIVGPPLPLPVLAVAMEPRHFREVHLNDAGHGRAWERAAHLDIITAEGKLAGGTGFGLRLHGGYGRRGHLATKKSYRAYFRGIYGERRLRWPVFGVRRVTAEGEALENERGDSFDKLVFRGGFNDRFRPGRGGYNVRAAYIRDQVIRDLHRDMGALSARGAWYLLYVNAACLGIYNVVERLDDDFLRAHLEGDAWDVIKTGGRVVAGDVERWHALLDFAARSDLAFDRNFDEIARQLDLENFTSYMILNLWAQNEDWPHNNWYAARARQPGAKWFFLSWDAELSMGLRPAGHQVDSIEYIVNPRRRQSGPGGVSIHRLFASLLRSARYRAYFKTQVRAHVKGALRGENVWSHVTRHAAAIAPVMESECRSFAPNYDADDWQRNVDDVKRFALARGEFLLRLLDGWSLFAEGEAR